jgi:Tfp pilus assembly protein FimT
MLNPKKHNSFTLFELLIILALLSLILITVVPLGLNFFQRQSLGEVTASLASVLKMAQDRAIAGKLDSSWGVKIFRDQGYYVLFPLFNANSFDDPTRDKSYDEVFRFSPIVQISGADEIIFEKFTGKPIIK